MEDRYLFKAKGQTSNRWYYGMLTFCGECTCHIKDALYNEKICDTSTLCQCTGLKDKNGKLIWENDIVRVTTNSGSTICRCAFADIVAQFQLWQEHTIKGTPTTLNLGNYECEVIGNIFDNPELLESEE